MQILIVEPDLEARLILELSLKKEFDFNIHARSDAIDATALLELFDDFIAVISVAQNKNEETAFKLSQKISSNTLLFVLGESNITKDDNVFFMDSLPNTKQIIDQIHSKIISSKKEENEKRIDSLPLKALSLEMLNFISCTPVDIHLKVKDKHKFQKYLSKDTCFEQAELTKLEMLNYKNIYIAEKDFIIFLDYITERLSIVFDSSELSKKSQKEVTQKFFSYLAELEMKPAVVEMAQKTIDSVFEEIDSEKNIKILLNKIFKENKDFKYQSSMMTAAISIAMVGQFSWSNNNIKRDLMFCSFLHDMFLSNKDKILIQSEQQLNNSFLTDKESVLVREHAKMSFDFLGRSDNIPQSTLKLVKHHHGAVSGIGFVQKDLSSAISEVEKLFIISESFSHQLLSSPKGKVNINRMAEKTESLYSDKVFQPYIEAFLKCFKS
tara:strand:- start:64486 stop:65799 length:1314 start_codon:yes stop_codon:yes gene_type:complete